MAATDKRFQQLTLAISKAINSQEMPVKEKHVRSAIIGSFQEQGAVTYWVTAIRLPLQDNRIVAWKFCHVTHKLLREGHPACLDDSQRHIGMLENLGKLWVHLREGYGKLISLYTALLATKLRFHSRNPQFPGNMAVSSEELDSIAENDVNNYFQLCVELFDYMDDILNLQAAVLDSLGNARANSMTASGQCRLAALIPCAQDSSHIYDCNVRLLFRLHAALPPDVLAGHRERFRHQFKKLSAFYKQTSAMQYFRNLLTLPQLPNNPPNFLIQSDFGTYVAPVVMIPEPEPEPEHDVVGSLVDTSDTVSQHTSQDNFDFVDSRASPSPPPPDVLLERDRLIAHLQEELRRQRAELAGMAEERGSMLVSMRDHCAELEAELRESKADLDMERSRAILLSSQTPEITQKLNEVEEKARVTDDKFQKLKAAYTQLRAEHISLIRQKAEVDKTAAHLKTELTKQEHVSAELHQKYNEQNQAYEDLQRRHDEEVEDELRKLAYEVVTLQTDLTEARFKEKELKEVKQQLHMANEVHEAIRNVNDQKIRELEDEVKKLNELVAELTQRRMEIDSDVMMLREELLEMTNESENKLIKAQEEKEEVLSELNTLREQFKQDVKMLEGKLEHSERGRLTAECGLQDLLQHSTSLEEDIGQLKLKLEQANTQLDNYKKSMLVTAGKAGSEMLERALSDLEVDPTDMSAAVDLVTRGLESLASSNIVQDGETAVAKDAVHTAHFAVQVANRATNLLATLRDNDVIDNMTSSTRSMLTDTKRCMEALGRGELGAAGDLSAAANRRVAELAAAGARAAAGGGVARSVDDELAEMDSAIEEAANRIEELLAASRAADSGVQLEVNNKILDACTTLMAAVKVLVRQARQLQSELGDPTTRRKMYMRNPQWSEGLISAAKAVVVAAKMLVSSADEAVSGSGAMEGVSAASHEVAGSTAQLVAASRARAAAGSAALAALTQASRGVAGATGAVVAAVRAAAALTRDHDDLETSALSLTATRRLEMECKVRSLELEAALDAERARLAALRRRHYQLAQQEENGNVTNGKR